MKQKIIISADSTCDLPQDFIKENHILITPLHIVLGGDTYEDLVNITPDDIYTYFDKTGLLPKTSAVNIQEYIDTFKPIVEQGCEIVHLNIGHALSTCYQHCKLAAKELGVKIHVVDSCNLSMGSGLLVMEAVDMMKQGLTAQEIAENLHNMTCKVQCSFVVDKMNYLKAGGRCSAVAAFGANLLNIKPCIEVNNTDGSMNVGKKYRGNLSKVLMQYIDNKMESYDNISKKRACVIHAGIDEETFNELVALVESKHFFDELVISRAGCTISSHCGPATMGFMFMTI